MSLLFKCLFWSSCFLSCTAASCTNCTQEMVFSPMWSVTSYSTSLKHCQLCVGPRPGSNCPIPALSLLVKASPVWLDKPCHGCFPLGPSSLGKHCLQCEWGSLSRCRSAQLYYKPSFTGTCTAEKENPTVMALAPRFDRGLSVVRIFSNLSFNITINSSNNPLIYLFNQIFIH